MIDLTFADLCSTCPVIWDRRAHKACPLCGAYSVLHLATVLNRREARHARDPHRVSMGINLLRHRLAPVRAADDGAR
jgi:hypothetical protein